jgi:hypothetical protein
MAEARPYPELDRLIEGDFLAFAKPVETGPAHAPVHALACVTCGSLLWDIAVHYRSLHIDVLARTDYQGEARPDNAQEGT